MLSVSNLKRAYGDFLAVDAVNFSIAKGEIVGLLGHNGAGKTTIMKMLSGYLEPSGGQIEFEGQLLDKSLKSVQKKIGYLPESLPVYPEMSVAEYLDYAAELKGISGDEKQKEVKRVMLATDIAGKLLAPIATLSRGFKQRVGVAQALLGNPRLLILDEPTNGLDPSQTLQMRNLILELAKNATVILSTHIMQEVDAICDRVLVMSGGRLVVDEKLTDLRKSRSLLITTNVDKEKAQSILSALASIKNIEVIDRKAGTMSYRLILSEAAELDQEAATIAKYLVNADAAIYEITTEIRDLETLFREVNASEVAVNLEVSHAA